MHIAKIVQQSCLKLIKQSIGITCSCTIDNVACLLIRKSSPHVGRSTEARFINHIHIGIQIPYIANSCVCCRRIQDCAKIKQGFLFSLFQKHTYDVSPINKTA